MKKVIAVFLSIMVIGSLGACSNTAEGAGKDLENMGRWMQDTF